MDRRERYYDPEEMMRLAMDSKQAQIWTALPAIIQSFNPDAMTCEAQPAVNGIVRQQDGTSKEIKMPLLLDCPVFFPGGGGLTLTFPIKPGDECLVIFASRCIDAWWQQGGIKGQAELRMHDLSDGFIFAGVRSQPRKFSVDTVGAQLRTDDGATYLEILPNGKVRIDAENIELHARNSYSWDVDGFGERWTSLGGGNYEHKTWQEGATISSVTLPINPPEGP
jgi:hypothetical protein